LVLPKNSADRILAEGDGEFAVIDMLWQARDDTISQSEWKRLQSVMRGSGYKWKMTMRTVCAALSGET
jgi:hypothetical protein